MCAALAAGVFAWGGPAAAPAGAATANFTCGGIDGDRAGSVAGAPKSSKELLALLATLGGSAELSLPVGVTVDAPASVDTGSGAYPVSFVYSIALPDSLVKSAKDLLKVSTLQVKDASFAVDVSGAASGTVAGSTAAVDVSLATSPVTVTQNLAGSVTPVGPGLVYYRPGAARFSVVVNGSAGGVAEIGTITVTCAATGLLGSTAVRPPGSPLIAPNPIVVPVTAGSSTSVNLDDGARVTPDRGNPIVWESLRIAAAASGGTAALQGRSITYTAPTANGSYDVTFEVCGAARTVPGAPGVDEVQTFTFADPAYSRDFPNVHPLAFTLTYDGRETAPIPTSFLDVDLFGNVTTFPFDPADPLSRTLHVLGGRFAPPTAAALQAALEALPNVAPGDIVVAGGPTSATDLTTPYSFTFGAALGDRDVPQIGLGQWDTWLPSEGLDAVLEAAKNLDIGGGPVPPTTEDSFAQLIAGTITGDQFWDRFWARVGYDVLQGIDVQGILDTITGLFPKRPNATSTVTGEAPIPESSTGPLCSQGVVQFVVTGGSGATTSTTPTRVAGTNVTSGSRATGATRVAGQVSYAG